MVAPRWLRRWFDARFVDGLRAAAVALYPANVHAPDAVGTDLIRRNEAYVRKMPPSSRFQIMLMYVLIEVLAPLLAPGFGGGSPFAGRFSRRPPARRLAMVMGWRASKLYPLRLLGNALHAQLQMIYLSHPSVMRVLGEYKPMVYEGDPFPIEVRPLPVIPPERA